MGVGAWSPVGEAGGTGEKVLHFVSFCCTGARGGRGLGRLEYLGRGGWELRVTLKGEYFKGFPGAVVPMAIAFAAANWMSGLPD